jgi:hypothetical protein
MVGFAGMAGNTMVKKISAANFTREVKIKRGDRTVCRERF